MCFYNLIKAWFTRENLNEKEDRYYIGYANGSGKRFKKIKVSGKDLI